MAEVWIDPDWYADQQSHRPAALARPARRRAAQAHVGADRPGLASAATSHPTSTCPPTTAISRRHAQLTTDGTRWWVEDLGSSNGTYVGDTVGALPTTPVPAGQKKEIPPDDRVYLGAWTRITVRKAAPGEVG